jgi:TatD DNase family protein
VRWTDNHCHLAPGAPAAEAVSDAAAAGVERLVVVGTDAEKSREAIEVARAHDGVWATVGVHPHDATEGIDGILALFDAPEVVAVGECGLDYHYDHSPRAVQREVFAAQIGIAHERNLPLVIHTREAWDDTFAILASERAPARTVFHCFTGGPSEAERGLEIGASLSFSGIVTFPSADDVREAAAICPLDRVLVETDSPYLTPVPHRGQRNRPALVPLVGEAVAAAQGVALDRMAEATWQNAERFYRLS